MLVAAAVRVGKAYPRGDAPFPGIYRLHTVPRPLARFRPPLLVSLGADIHVALAGTAPWRLTVELRPLGCVMGQARRRPVR
jgi:hypothetical protein